MTALRLDRPTLWTGTAVRLILGIDTRYSLKRYMIRRLGMRLSPNNYIIWMRKASFLEGLESQRELVSNRPTKKQTIGKLGGGVSSVESRGVGSEATLVPLPKVTRSGRNISLPSKFRQ
jgi:hypothetical protein